MALALGIGATTTVFAFVSGALLKPLPYKDPERLVMMWQDRSASGGPAREVISPGLFVDWSTRATALVGVSAIRIWSPNLTGKDSSDLDEPERLAGPTVTGDYFHTLGLSPLHGRVFTKDDDRFGAANAVVLSHRLWMRRFAGDPGLIGQTVISSLQTRLMIAVGLLATAAVVAVGLSARQSARQEFERFQTVERVREEGASAASLERIAATLDGKCCSEREVGAAAAGLASDTGVFVFSAEGGLLVAAGPGVAGLTVTAQYRDSMVSIKTRSSGPGLQAGTALSLKGVPMKAIRLADGSAAQVLLVPWQVARGEGPAERFLGSVDRRLLSATTLAALVSLLLTWMAARRILRPIAELRDATRDLAKGQLTRRVSAHGEDEVVSDLEDLAHAEGRDLAFSIAVVDVADAFRSALRAASLEGDPRVRIEIEPGLSAEADTTRLRQVLVNLLTNADRHTPPSGAITLRAARRDSVAVISVHNSGSTLSPPELERVFDRFYRADPSRQRATGGSGLGLAIVKHLVEAQSGTVSARSDDRGVTFEVTLPSR